MNDNKIIDKLIRVVNSENKIPDNWYGRLRFFREEVLEKSQSEVARDLGITMTAISRYENGRGAKEFTPGFYRKIKNTYGKEVAEWIESGKLPKEDNNAKYVNNIGTLHAGTAANKIVGNTINTSIGGEHLSALEAALVELYRKKKEKVDEMTLFRTIIECIEKI